MSALITVYDNITSNKYVSLGITAVAFANSGLRVYGFIERANPILIVVTTCAGVALALLTKSYLDGIQKIDNSRDKNSLYATMSILSTVAPIGYRNPRIFSDFIWELNFHDAVYFSFDNHGSLGFGVGLGFSLGFTATTLILELAESKKTISKK